MSQRLIKLARSLQHKKYRIKEKLFIAEGEKLVLDLISSFNLKYILCTEAWAEKHPQLETSIASMEILKKASSLKNTSEVIGFFEIKEQIPFDIQSLPALVLDRLQDPGNLGSLIRTAAWFGIKHIVCSPDTVDVYNPKVIQATMGAMTLVNIHYQPLDKFLADLQKKNIKIYGTFLEGKSIYQTSLDKKSVIIIGNEGQGISEELKKFISHPIHIPPANKLHPESLNASISAAIVCAEMTRTTQN